MDAIALLKEDHAAMKELFDRYEELGDGAEASKRQLADRIIHDLSIHAAIEEQFLYSYARQRDERLAKLVYQALEEHCVAKWELSSLEKHQPGDERFDAKMTVLMENVRHHIQEEEQQLLPRLSELCDPAELEGLGDTLRKAKQVAPTHPHPRAPDQPPGIAMTPVLAAMDRGRDLASQTIERSRKLVENTLERGRKLVRRQGRRLEALRKDATTLSRRMGKRTVEVARLTADLPSRPKRKTVARVTASRTRAAKRPAKSSRSRKRT